MDPQRWGEEEVRMESLREIATESLEVFSTRLDPEEFDENPA